MENFIQLLNMDKQIEGWTIGLHGQNRKYFHYLKQNKWLCGTVKFAIPTKSSVKLGLCSLHEEINDKQKCKKCKKILSIK